MQPSSGVNGCCSVCINVHSCDQLHIISPARSLQGLIGFLPSRTARSGGISFSQKESELHLLQGREEAGSPRVAYRQVSCDEAGTQGLPAVHKEGLPSPLTRAARWVDKSVSVGRSMPHDFFFQSPQMTGWPSKPRCSKLSERCAKAWGSSARMRRSSTLTRKQPPSAAGTLYNSEGTPRIPGRKKRPWPEKAALAVLTP